MSPEDVSRRIWRTSPGKFSIAQFQETFLGEVSSRRLACFQEAFSKERPLFFHLQREPIGGGLNSSLAEIVARSHGLPWVTQGAGAPRTESRALQDITNEVNFY